MTPHRVLLEHVLTDGDVTFLPVVADNGMVGYRCEHTDGRSEFLYFNPSRDEESGDGGPDGGPGNNVFVYSGPHFDPSLDSPLHFYYIFDDRDQPKD